MMKSALTVDREDRIAVDILGNVMTCQNTGAKGTHKIGHVDTDTQSVLQPLIPYLDTLRWLFIITGLIGVGITIYARWDDWQKGRR